MDPINVDADPPQNIGKRRRTGPSGPRRVVLDSVTLQQKLPPAARSTRRSTQNTNANGKKDVSNLFARLGQEFHAIAMTFEQLGEVLD